MAVTGKLELRNAKIEDIPEIVDLVNRVYAGMGSYRPEVLRGQITNLAALW